jgi:hypothetical protein
MHTNFLRGGYKYIQIQYQCNMFHPILKPTNISLHISTLFNFINKSHPCYEVRILARNMSITEPVLRQGAIHHLLLSTCTCKQCT